MPLGTPLSESLCAAYGGPDSYDIHGLETAQCMSERRRGGEVGIRRVHGLRGAAFWQELARRASTVRRLEAALVRSHNLPGRDG